MTSLNRPDGPSDSENPSRDSDENLTVVVFRQNDTSRSFQVSLRWIKQLGWLSGALVLLTAVSVILALRFYREAKLADPSRVHELERDLKDLKLAHAKLETKNGTPGSTASPLPEQIASVAQGPSPAPASHPAVSPPGAIVAAEPPGMPFTLFPGGTQAIPAPDSRPINISQPKISISGRVVRAKFAFQYIADDQGSQQGRFVLLARGADSAHVYPAGALGTGSAGSLILPDKGEYFSVSRYREVNAEFSVGAHGSMPTSLEVFVFTPDGKLYMHQTLPVTASAARGATSAPRPRKTAAPDGAAANPADGAAAPATEAAPQSETPGSTGGDTP